MDANLRTSLFVYLGMLASALYWRIVTGQVFYVYLFLGLAISIFAVCKLFQDVVASAPSVVQVSRLERLLSDGATIASGVSLFTAIAYGVRSVSAGFDPSRELLFSLMNNNFAIFFGSMGCGLYFGHYLDHYPGKVGLLFLIGFATLFFWARGSGAFDSWINSLPL